MNLKPNKHKTISFSTMTMASLGFIAPPPKILGPPLNLAPLPKFNFLLRSPPSPPNYFGQKFLGPTLKLGGSCYHDNTIKENFYEQELCMILM